MWTTLVDICEPSHWVCKRAYLVRVPSQDKVAGLWQEGHPASKWGDDGGGSPISPDGVAVSRMVGVSASVIFRCTIKFEKFSSGTGLSG